MIFSLEELVEPDDHVEVYCFEDGAVIYRIVTPRALSAHSREHTSLRDKYSENYVHFALRLRPRRSVIVAIHKSGDGFFINEKEDISFFEWTIPYLAEFFEQVITADWEIPRGSWGPFEAPIWLDDGIFDRANDEERLDELHADFSIERAIEYARYVFGDILSIKHRGARIDLGPPVGRKVLTFEKTYLDTMYFRMTDPDNGKSIKGHSIAELLKMKLPKKANFLPMGEFRRMSERESWVPERGHATFNVNTLESYFLLNEVSPLLLPADSFLSWWRVVTDV